MSTQESDMLKLKLYHEFYEQHKDLFKKNPQEYHHECSRFVQAGLEKVVYGHK
jgi:hypothetical protein